MFCPEKADSLDIRKKNPVQETGVKNSKNDHISVSGKQPLDERFRSGFMRHPCEQK